MKPQSLFFLPGIFFACMTLVRCGAPAKAPLPETATQTQPHLAETPPPDTLTADGTITIRPFINKIGTVDASATDYFFKTGTHDYFIKLSESQISETQLRQSADKPVTLTYLLSDGNWDTRSGQNEQSRVGEYVAVLKIKQK